MSSFTQLRCFLFTVSVHACARCIYWGQMLTLGVFLDCSPPYFWRPLTDSANLAEHQAPGTLLPLPPGTGTPGTRCNFSCWEWPRSSHLDSKHCSAWPISQLQRKYLFSQSLFFPDSAGHPEPGLWKCGANALLLSYIPAKGSFSSVHHSLWNGAHWVQFHSLT